MKALLKAIVLFVVCGPALAEQLPNATDLRAAYCRPIVRRHIEVLRAAARLGPQKIEEAEADARRLDLYLVPRIPHLSALGLVAAQTGAEEDLARSDAFGRRCEAGCEGKDDSFDCFIRCVEKNPFGEKFRTCRPVTWLPF